MRTIVLTTIAILAMAAIPGLASASSIEKFVDIIGGPGGNPTYCYGASWNGGADCDGVALYGNGFTEFCIGSYTGGQCTGVQSP